MNDTLDILHILLYDIEMFITEAKIGSNLGFYDFFFIDSDRFFSENKELGYSIYPMSDYNLKVLESVHQLRLK